MWLEGTGTNMLHVPEVGAIVVNYRDITARVQAEEQVRFQAHGRLREPVRHCHQPRGEDPLLE